MTPLRIPRGVRVAAVAAVLALCAAAAAAAVPPDGDYTGTTSQDLPFSLTVSGGVVTGFSLSSTACRVATKRGPASYPDGVQARERRERPKAREGDGRPTPEVP